MSWASDASANRYIKTYYNGFVDISGGNLILRNGNVTFPDGTTQNTASTSDSWINNNIVNSPPAIVFNTAYASTSSMIYVSWSYPTQLEIGMLNLYLPVINSFTATLTAQISGTVSTNTLINNDSTTNTIRYNGQTETTNYITGIVLTNINVNTGYQTLTFPGESTPRHCYVSYSSTYANLQDNSGNKITCWYTNYQAAPNTAFQHFNIFLTAGAPSAPGQPTFGTQSTSNTGIQVVATTTTPTYTDGLNHTNTAAMQNYRMTRSTTGDSTFRYGGAITDSGITYGSGASLSVTLQNLYPDSTYNVYAQGQNNSTNQSYGDSSTTAILYTTNLPASTTYGHINFSPSSVTAKLVSTQSPASNVIFANPTTLTSSLITSPIHYEATRGKTTSGLYKIAVTVTRNGTTIDTGNILFNGFPIATPTAYSSSNIGITPSASTDYYNASTSSPYAGYYLLANSNIVLKSPVFVASNQPTVTTVVQTQYQANGTTPNNTDSSNYQFYYDTYSGNPAFTSSTISLRDLSSNQISGVYIANTNIGLNVTTVLPSGLGTYFYNPNQILRYTDSVGPAQEVDLGNFSAGSKNSTNLLYPVTITNTTSVSKSYDTFSLGFSLATTAYGPTDTTTGTTSNSLSVVLDNPTLTQTYITTVNTTFAGSGVSNQYGWRLGSQTATTYGSPNSSAYVYTLPPGASYGQTIYDNSVLLTATNNGDLQRVNGKYLTKGSSSTAYLNYTSYYRTTTLFNTANYAGITATGYRYATFAWKVTNNTSNYTKVQFIINGISASISNPNGLPTVGSTRLYLYYRVEDVANYGTMTATYRNTTWLDINAVTNPVSGTNYYTTTILDAKDTAVGKDNSFSGGQYVVNGVTPSFNCLSGDNLLVYFRVCAPMNENFDFSSVQCNLT